MELDDEILKDPKRLVHFIDKAMQEDPVVEIQLNGKTRIFYTHFRDHLPDPIVATSSSNSPDLATETVVSRKNAAPIYRLRSYLLNMDHLLIDPLVPAIGNALIRSSQEIVVRYFQGIKAIESKVSYLGILEVAGEPAINLSFPHEATVLRKRRHFRAKVIPELKIILTVSGHNFPAITTQIIDISAGGLAFCNPLVEDLLPPDEHLELLIVSKEFPEFKVTGFVRNHGRATIKDGCCKDSTRCGIQFDVLSEKMAMRVEELVAYVQREHLQRINAQRETCRPSPAFEEPPPPKEEKPPTHEGIKQLFNLKKKFSFSAS